MCLGEFLADFSINWWVRWRFIHSKNWKRGISWDLLLEKFLLSLSVSLDLIFFFGYLRCHCVIICVSSFSNFIFFCKNLRNLFMKNYLICFKKLKILKSLTKKWSFVNSLKKLNIWVLKILKTKNLRNSSKDIGLMWHLFLLFQIRWWEHEPAWRMGWSDRKVRIN